MGKGGKGGLGRNVARFRGVCGGGGLAGFAGLAALGRGLGPDGGDFREPLCRWSGAALMRLSGGPVLGESGTAPIRCGG